MCTGGTQVGNIMSTGGTQVGNITSTGGTHIGKYHVYWCNTQWEICTGGTQWETSRILVGHTVGQYCTVQVTNLVPSCHSSAWLGRPRVESGMASAVLESALACKAKGQQPWLACCRYGWRWRRSQPRW